jgi:uncharacterized Zn-binding protein involved in type VI secretion
MGQPVAKRGDRVVGLDKHIVLVTGPGAPVPTPMPFPFCGPLSQDLSRTVCVDGAEAATVGSQAQNTPAHIPVGGSFQKPPSNQATVKEGSSTVFADNRSIARCNDGAQCCNDPVDMVSGHVVAAGTVLAGG